MTPYPPTPLLHAPDRDSRSSHRLLLRDCEWRRVFQAVNATSRQKEVLQAVFAGATDQRIARQLGVAQPTVRTHLAGLFELFQVNDRTSLVIEVVRIALGRDGGHEPEDPAEPR